MYAGGTHALLLWVGARQGRRSRSVGGVVQEGVDLVDEEGIQALSDLFLVCEGEGALVGDPERGLVSGFYLS